MSTISGDYLADLTSGDDERAEAAASGLASLPAAQVHDVIGQLTELLASPDVDTRWWAVRALSELPDAHVPAMLVEALGDSDAAVRQCAVLGLRIHPDGNAVPTLLGVLTGDDPLAADLAADALAVVGDRAVPSLLEILENGQPSARLKALRALAFIGDERSIPALFAALDEESALMEYWAAEGLERMGVGMTFFKPD